MRPSNHTQRPTQGLSLVQPIQGDPGPSLLPTASDPVSKPPTPTITGFLLQDPIVRLALLALAIAIAPYLLPGLSSDVLATWAILYTDPLLVATCLLAFQFRLSRLADSSERRFWQLWTLALSAWLVKSFLVFWFDKHEIWTLGSDLTLNSCYFLFYSCAAIALESRPQPSASPQARLARRIERVGTLVFFFGLLLYFTIIPAFLDPAAYESSSLLLFVALDFYLVARLASLRDAASTSASPPPT